MNVLSFKINKKASIASNAIATCARLLLFTFFPIQCDLNQTIVVEFESFQIFSVIQLNETIDNKKWSTKFHKIQFIYTKSILHILYNGQIVPYGYQFCILRVDSQC